MTMQPKDPRSRSARASNRSQSGAASYQPRASQSHISPPSEQYYIDKNGKRKKVKKPPGPLGKAAKVAFAPEIGQSMQGIKFAWHMLVNMVAQIYMMVRLIPADHPCGDLRNASHYRLKDIIRIAYGSLRWEKSHAPQIAIFFAVLGFLIFVALGFVTLVMSLGVDVANAQPTSGSTPNAVNDVLNKIFNLNGNNTMPTAFGGMLAAYSKLILILAGLILLWTIISTVVETMREGKPFGKSFNGTWTPVRIVFALGLLIPLSSGLNSGQYITLYLAKWGSDIATDVFKYFSGHIGAGQGVIASRVTVQPQKKLEDLFNFFACIEKKKITYDPITMGQPQPISGQEHWFQIVAGGPSMNQQQGCGSVKFYNNPNPTKVDEEILRAQFVHLSHIMPYIRDLAFDFVSHRNPQSTNYFKEIMVSEYRTKMKAYADNYASLINNSINMKVDELNKNLSKDINQSLEESGWVAAPMFFHRLVDANIRVNQAALALPEIDVNGSNQSGSFMSGGFLDDDVEVEEKPNLWQVTARVKYEVNQWLVDNVLTPLRTVMGGAALEMIAKSDNPLIGLVILGRMFFLFGGALVLGWTVLAGAIGFGATVGTNVVLAIGGLVTMIMMLIFTLGLTLGFILPLSPTIRFLFGAIGWLVLVLVAVAGMPLFALAHLRTGGEGFVGQLQVQSAYNMLMGIVVRPTLIVIGFILGMVIFKFLVQFTFPILMGSVKDLDYSLSANNFDGLNVITSILGILFMANIFAGFFIALANASFKLIDIIPAQAMTWMGSGAMQNPVEDANQEFGGFASSAGQSWQSSLMKAPEAAGYSKPIQEYFNNGNKGSMFGSFRNPENAGSASSNQGGGPGGDEVKALPGSSQAEISATPGGGGGSGGGSQSQQLTGDVMGGEGVGSELLGNDTTNTTTSSAPGGVQTGFQSDGSYRTQSGILVPPGAQATAAAQRDAQARPTATQQRQSPTQQAQLPATEKKETEDQGSTDSQDKAADEEKKGAYNPMTGEFREGDENRYYGEGGKRSLKGLWNSIMDASASPGKGGINPMAPENNQPGKPRKPGQHPSRS